MYNRANLEPAKIKIGHQGIFSEEQDLVQLVGSKAGAVISGHKAPIRE